MWKSTYKSLLTLWTPCTQRRVLCIVPTENAVYLNTLSVLVNIFYADQATVKTFPYSLSSALFVLRSLDFSSGAECNRRAVSSFNISAFEEVLKALIRVLAKLNIEWPKERWEAPHRKLDECFLTSGQAQPPKRNCWCYRLRRLTCWRSWVPARASCMAKIGIKDKEKKLFCWTAQCHHPAFLVTQSTPL